jgi:hypothetical protein
MMIISQMAGESIELLPSAVDDSNYVLSYRFLVDSLLSGYIGLIVLMMEASISETSANFTRLHGATFQKTVIFIFAAVRTWILTWKVRILQRFW